MKLPQLSLREMFLWVLVAALAVGWWVERSRVRLSEKESRALIQAMEGQREQMNALMEAADPTGPGWVFERDESGELRAYPGAPSVD